MEQQIAQTTAINTNGFRSEKKIRLGTGLGFRNQSQIQRPFNKNSQSQHEQIPNGASNGGSSNHQSQNQQQFNITCNNYYVGSQSPTNSIQLQQQALESPQTTTMNTNQLSSSQTQNGFFRRKINLKMSSTNLKAFLGKQSNENPIMIKSSKNRFVNSHLSQGSIQTHSINAISLNPNQQLGNFFGSQVSLPCPSISNSSNAHSPQTHISALNNTHNVNANSTFQTAINSVQNNSNSETRRSSNLQMSDQANLKYAISNFKKGDIIAAFNRGKRISQKQSKNTSFTRHELNEQNQEKKQVNSEDKSDSHENQDIEDKNEDANHQKNTSFTKNTIANYSHNTESTNATAQISHHNYPLHMSHHYFDSDKIKKKQSLTTSQTFIPSSQTQLSTPNLYVKKKITEAKQYSNQVRQQMFEQQDLEEEENFLELCETLQKINYD